MRQPEIFMSRLRVAPDVVIACSALLSEAERHRARRFKLDRDRRRFIVARARLREILAAKLGVHASEIELSNTEKGKPRLAGRFAASTLRFNVSHCEDIAVFAFCDGAEVGVDIESVRPMKDVDKLAARAFAPHEIESLRALEGERRIHGFFACWTRKEAFIKAVGDGFSYTFGSLDTSRCRIETFSPAPGFIGAVVTQQS
jgi:4'-phosphopantetheinyl transferase